jgi:YfiH family protein
VRLPQPFHAAREHIAIDLPGAHILFTTRRGGFSTGPFWSLNLGRFTDDQPSAVARNRATLASALGVRFAYGRQVHGPRVQRVSAPQDELVDPAEADGQATGAAGVGLMVLTADCLPVAVAGVGAAAMLHAGWRGLAAGVIAEGVAAVRELGADEPLSAAVGPGAGPCCYEVGDEIHAAFDGLADRGVAVSAGRNLNLKAIAAAQLGEAGVEVVHDVKLCTICTSEFFSHRRDHGTTGRQAGVAWLS